ncbi:MAG: VWA domain-containing protein [Fuerstiella sp.]
MTFLNSALAFGAAAFLIPLVIHILNRSRFRTVEWGAMHLLESVIRVNHRRFHLEQLILLLIRCAIPVLLALCLARPVLTGSELLEGDAPVSLVILLDTSYSLDAVSRAGTHFDEAIEAACAIVSATGRGSEVAVIQTGGRPTPLFDQPVFDPEAVLRRLKQLQGGYGASDMPAALDEALATLSAMSHARRELIVISDFQPADWKAVNGEAAAAIRGQIQAMNIKPELTLLQVGEPVRGNISVESLQFPQRAIGVGQQFSVRAEIRNHGSTDFDSARVILRLDAEEYSVSQVSLGAGSSTQTLFPCVVDSPGSHVLEVEVVAGDPLPTDNRSAAAITIWDHIDVLLVDGDPASLPLQSETDFLSVALTPYTFGRVRLSDLVRTQTVSADQLTAELLHNSRVVVLANVSTLKDEQLADLSAWVHDGGALLVCAGNRIDLNWYRERMFAAGQGLLPLPFGVPRAQTDESARAARIVAQHFDHPALEFFNDPAHGDLSTAEIRQWCQVVTDDAAMSPVRDGTDAAEVTSASEPLPSVRGSRILPVVMARLDNGDPLLVERPAGDGTVVQLATACDADWSDLPMRPFFVPLMQQLVTTMASRISPPRNIATGDPAVALLPVSTRDGDDSATDHAGADSDADADESSGRNQTEDGYGTASVVTPDGSRRSIRLVPQGRLQMARFDATQRPGIYVLNSPMLATIHFVAETSREESDLTMMEPSALASLAEDLAARVAESPTAYLDQDRLRRHGREIWPFVLAGLLGLMFLELVLQQNFARVRV